MIVASAVDKDEADVSHELVNALVVVEVITWQLWLYCAEVYWVTDDLVIVRHLKATKADTAVKGNKKALAKIRFPCVYTVYITSDNF